MNDFPESQRALCGGTRLARAYKSSLATVPILGDLPAYIFFAIVVDPEVPNVIRQGQRRVHGELHGMFSLLAQEHGIQATDSTIEGREVQARFQFLKENRADLFDLGFICLTSIYPDCGVRFMTSRRKLHAACSVFIECAGQSQLGISIEMVLGSEALRHE